MTMSPSFTNPEAFEDGGTIVDGFIRGGKAVVVEALYAPVSMVLSMLMESLKIKMLALGRSLLTLNAV